MQNKRTQLAIIHVAKKQLGLDEEAYRAVLSGAGAASAKDITNGAQFNTIMAAFQQLGFKSTSRAGKRRTTAAGVPGMISRRQEYYIKGLWALASRAKDELSLRRLVKRIGKVDDISFLSRRNASAVILALRDICWKAGFNPDTKEGLYVTNGQGSGAGIAPGASSGVLPSDNGAYRSGANRQGVAVGAGSS